MPLLRFVTGLNNDCDDELDEDIGEIGDLCSDDELVCGTTICGGEEGLQCERYADWGDSCDTGELGACAEGSQVCSADGLGVECRRNNEPTLTDELGDGIDSDCDGYEGDLDRLIFVSSTAAPSAATGTRERPYPSINTAIVIAGLFSPPRDIVIAAGDYPVSETVRLSEGVSLYGSARPTDFALGIDGGPAHDDSARRHRRR